MKQIIITLSIVLMSSVFTFSTAQNINVNINLDKQPAWGPTGHDYVEYYYFPDLDVYFDVNSSLFYYSSGSKWISNRYLPDKYNKYDLYSLYKVVINGNQPWKNNKTHKKEYSKYKNNKSQAVIKNSKDTKYNNSKNNSVSWVENKEKNNSKSSTSNKQSNKKSSTNNNRGK